MRWTFFALALCGYAANAEENLAPLEEVLVVGEHPGPGLWKVSKGSLLFILGTYVPLPKDLVWRSKEVETAIERSSEILGSSCCRLLRRCCSRRAPTSDPDSHTTGDISALQALIEQDASYARARAYSWPFLSDDEVQRLHREAENQLLAAIERAINRNDATFAALPIQLLLGEQGVIARLHASGYAIEEPELLSR